VAPICFYDERSSKEKTLKSRMILRKERDKKFCLRGEIFSKGGEGGGFESCPGGSGPWKKRGFVLRSSSKRAKKKATARMRGQKSLSQKKKKARSRRLA